MKLLVKILALIFALAGAALGIALLKQEHAPSYISVYDTDDDLFWFYIRPTAFTASPPFMEGFTFFVKKLGKRFLFPVFDARFLKFPLIKPLIF